MNGTIIGVSAALLLGGGALYGVYQVVDADRPDDAELAGETRTRDERAAQLADRAERRVTGRSGSGAPDGVRAEGFGVGAEGADVTDAARARAEEAEREAERLAMLGTGDVDITRTPDDGSGDGTGGTAAGQETALAERERGLREAAGAELGGAVGADAGRGTATDRASDVERMLADIAAREAGTNGGGNAAGGTSADDAAGVPNGSVAGQRVAARLVDKPDQGGFAARLVDKPDQGGFVASADTQRFDPCQKADGTLYVGPGTALNPFAEADPCLPQATAQGYQVASIGATEPAPPLTVVDPAEPITFVDVARPSITPPPPVGTGSDYRG